MFANEIRLLPSPAKSEVTREVAWCFPGNYSIGMSGLGFQLVYCLLDEQPDFRIRRVFQDTEESIGRDCRLFGFTMSWELDFINVLSMLKKHGIPYLSQARQDSDPIVFGGGPVLTANPEPYANIFDVILLGDAEETIPRFAECIRSLDRSDDRAAILKKLAQTPGIYVPSLYSFDYDYGATARPIDDAAPQQVSKLLFRASDDYVAHSKILTPDTTWGDIFLIEVARSCPQECRFCLASYLTRPFRAALVDTVLSRIDLALPFTRKIGLMGPSITEHPNFIDLIDGLLERSKTGEPLNVSVASVRADTLDVELVRKLSTLGQKSLTIALESGSERLRRIMKKNLTEEQVIAAADAIAGGGMKGVKFYLIAGLPFEEWHDLEETVRLITLIKKRHKKLKMVAGISSFVPKAQTPFQWKGRDRKSKEKIEFLRKNLAKIGVEVRPESHNWSDIQALLSRGDRRLTDVLLGVAERGDTLGAWKAALRERDDHVPSLDYYAYRDIEENEPLPWSHLCQVEKSSYINKQMHQATMEAAL